MERGSALSRAARYKKHLKKLRGETADEATAMRQAVGTDFSGIGILERELLISQGLEPDGFVVDVGCGTGRLALPLSSYLTGPYLGTDVVPDFLSYARKLVNRPDWRFELATGFTIPAEDQSADIVCFFSVFTHLLHEESYAYLLDARRVLKPTGRIVFSFLEFAVPGHWPVFESTLAAIGSDYHHNQFMSRDGVEAWASHLGMEAEVRAGDEHHIPLREPVTLDNGRTYESFAPLGQSVAVLRFA